MNCQDHLYPDANPRGVARRWFLKQCGVGLGTVALGHLMRDAGFAAGDPLAPKAAPGTDPSQGAGGFTQSTGGGQ